MCLNPTNSIQIKKMISILGSGFGLYGYLPTLAKIGNQQIILPKRYQTRFFARPELAPYIGQVQWTDNENMAIEAAKGIVLALRPTDQMMWIRQCLEYPQVEFLLLEKPLAPCPETAAKVFDDLLKSEKKFRIGYLFRYTLWAQSLSKIIQSSKENSIFRIQWTFHAHHFRNDLQNWKRNHFEGGGAIRFYGVHLIALLAEMGYRNVTSSKAIGKSKEEIEKWNATFVGLNLPNCDVEVDTRSASESFLVQQSSESSPQLTKTLTDQNDPLKFPNEMSSSAAGDHRLPIIKRHYQSLFEDSHFHYQTYRNSIELWKTLEEKTVFETTN